MMGGNRCSLDDRRIVDSVLRDFPSLCLCLRQRREYLESLARSGGSDCGRIQGGTSIPAQERVLLALTSDVEYCELSAVVEVISGALGDLSESMYAVVDGLFFRHLSLQEICEKHNCGEKWIRIRRSLSYDVLSGPVFRVYPVVRRWRHREQARREEALRLLCHCG
ncbi:MAG: hypothetical protein EOM65_11135 [Synergistales bacterium]|nr:hypothetical protein [Synergistales bacterium]